MTLTAVSQVVHVKTAPFDVYIGRGAGGFQPSIWGNPFKIGTGMSREAAIDCYRAYLLNTPSLLAQLWTLRGKALGCWCHPEPCHGDVLAEFASLNHYSLISQLDGVVALAVRDELWQNVLLNLGKPWEKPWFNEYTAFRTGYNVHVDNAWRDYRASNPQWGNQEVSQWQAARI